MQFPFGIRGIQPDDLIDFDQAAIFIETCDHGYGKCYIGRDLNEEGPYGHSKKYTLTLAIGNGPRGDRWLSFNERAGTGINDILRFFEADILPDIRNERRTFICDNLNAHHSPVLRHFIHHNGHRIVYRAPYYARDGPVEYVFNRLQHELTIRMHEIYNHIQLEMAVTNKFHSIQIL